MCQISEMDVAFKYTDCSNISALNRDKKERRFFESVLSFKQLADKVSRILPSETEATQNRI
jgi:hypothetical protein